MAVIARNLIAEWRADVIFSTSFSFQDDIIGVALLFPQVKFVQFRHPTLAEVLPLNLRQFSGKLYQARRLFFSCSS